MALLASYTFEGLTPGAAVTPSGPWVITGTAGNMRADAAAAEHGALGGRMAAVTTMMTLDFTESIRTTTRILDVYYTPRVINANALIFSLRSDSTTRGEVRVAPTGIVSIRNVNTAVATSVIALTMATTYRLAWRTATTGQELRVYVGESDTPLFTLAGALTSNSHNQLGFGLVAGIVAYSADYDTARIADDWLAPVGATPPPGPALTVWNGTALQDVELVGVWNGTAVVPVAVLGVWDGAAVVAIE